VTLHCLTTLAGMLSAPVAFFYINIIYDFFNSLCCNILKVKIVINIHMIFYFHYTRVCRGVIYHIMPNFIGAVAIIRQSDGPTVRYSDKCFKLMKVLKNNLAKNDIFVILGYGPFIFIRPSKYGLIMAYRCSSVRPRLVR
jgi:hypothetical protein